MEQMSTTSSGVDLATKYQKLAAEYSKVRAQLPVLKKAVVDEQAKSSSFEDDLRLRDQQIRTLTTESESLTFRNQQLAKRVEFLQERLDESGAASANNSPARFFRRPSLSAKHSTNRMSQSISHDQLGGGANNHGTSPDSVKRALEEELKRKLDENERLNKQIFESESTHQNEISAMKNCLRLMENEAMALRNELANIKDRQEAVLAELRSEKAQLRQEATGAHDELDRLRSTCNENSSARSELSTELNSARRLISSRVLFDDSSRDAWNGLNTPSIDSNGLRGEYFHGLSAVQPSITQTLTHLGLFHSYWKQRAQLYPCDTNLGETMSENNAKLNNLLRENANVCRAVEAAFQELTDKARTDDGFATLIASDLSAVITVVSDYDRFLTASSPLIRKAMEDECDVSWCNPRLDKENRAFANTYDQYARSVERLSTDLRSIIAMANDQDNQEVVTEREFDEAPRQSLSSALDLMDESLRALCDQFSAKILNEHQLPVATRQLRTTNECIAAALNSSAKYVGELARTYREIEPVLLQCTSVLAHRRPEWAEWRRRAAQFHRMVAEIPDEESESTNKSEDRHSILPVSTSWHNLRFNGDVKKDAAMESELKGRLEETQKSLGVLEREKEKWILEMQLLKMKLEQQSANHTLSGGTDQSADRRSDDSAYVEEYYGNRVADLSSQLQDANSRIIFFQSECQSLLKTIQVYQKQKEKSNGELKLTTQQNVLLKDDLETTRKGYETQLSTLSEHLAQMNQKLTRQTDEIDMLRQAMKDKLQKPKNRFK